MTTNRRSIGMLALLLSLGGSLLPVPARAGGAQLPPSPVWPAANVSFKVPLRDPGVNRFTVDIEPGPTAGQSLRLGEVTVLDLAGRQVRLQFTVRSVQPPMFKNPGLRDVAFNPSAASLVTLDVDARVVRR